MPASKDFEFCKPIRGSAREAPTTIAEGFGRFRPADFARYLEFARAETPSAGADCVTTIAGSATTAARHARRKNMCLMRAILPQGLCRQP